MGWVGCRLDFQVEAEDSVLGLAAFQVSVVVLALAASQALALGLRDLVAFRQALEVCLELDPAALAARASVA